MSIDIFFLKEEVEPSDTVTALDAVMSVDEERLKLEKQADELATLKAEVAAIAKMLNSQQASNGQQDVLQAK